MESISTESRLGSHILRTREVHKVTWVTHAYEANITKHYDCSPILVLLSHQRRTHVRTSRQKQLTSPLDIELAHVFRVLQESARHFQLENSKAQG